jgi:hypothetical protein
VWHASLTLWSKGWVNIHPDRWGGGVLRAARLVMAETLEGVGTGPNVEQIIGTCMHWRRSLTEEEMSRLTVEWLAIPARDEFSPEGGIEKRL